MSTMERILRLMAEKKASDVYLSANAPALIKINGECVPINNQILPPDAPRNLLSEVVPPDRIEELEETGELNMGVPLTGVGRFRVSAMRQRGSYAVVIRFISQQIPEFDTLGLPPVMRELIMEKRGLILMVGATGSGKSTPIFNRATGEISYGRVPSGSVVVSGNLPKTAANGAPYSMYAAIIVKQVDAQTRSKTSINDLLRD